MSKISIFSITANQRTNGYEYLQGYDQCSEDIKRVCGKMMTREEENTIEIQALMRDSFQFINMVERDPRANRQREARELRSRYEALLEKIKGL